MRSYKSHVPAAPFQKLLQEELDKRNQETELEAHDRGNQHHTSTQVFRMLGPDFVSNLIWPELSYNARRQRLLRLMQENTIHFDVADLILCKLDKVQLWRIDPELREIYFNANLAHIDSLRPAA